MDKNDRSDIIHVCFGLHDKTGKYSKYVGTAICSVLENTDNEVMFHILHDDTLSEENKKYLVNSAESLSGKIQFYKVNMKGKDFAEYDLSRFTVGTLFRLKICEMLKDVSKVIYMDSDIVVNIDIADLWRENLGDKLMAGCILPVNVSVPLIDKGLVQAEEYVNSGVLIMDIERIRKKHDMWRECIDFITKKPDLWRAPDQDAIAWVFKGEIKGIDEKYNSRAYLYRNENSIGEKRIYHFIGDSPRDTFDYVPDRLFFEAFRKTPWGSEMAIINHYEKRIKEKDNQKRIVYDLMKAIYEEPSKRKVFWGIGGAIHSKIMDMLPWNEGDYFVDSKKTAWGKEHGKGIVYSPEQLKTEDHDSVIIIVTIFRYNEVKAVLESYGFTENSNFFNGKYLLPESDTLFCAGERDCKWDL